MYYVLFSSAPHENLCPPVPVPVTLLENLTVFVATFLRAFDSNIPPPPACSARARVDPVLQH